MTTHPVPRARRFHGHYFFFSAALAGAALARDACASVLIDPDQLAISATSYYPTFGQVPSKSVDHSGLSSPLPTGSPVPSSDDNYPSHDTVLVDMYRSGKDTHPDLTFGLNGRFELTGMHYWNFNGDNRASHPSGGDRETPDDGIQSVDIAVASNAFGPYTTIGTFTLDRAPALDTYTGSTLSFGSAVDAQYVRFHINTNFAVIEPSDPTSYFGLSEIRFIGTAAVPEPSSLGLCGLAGGLLLRRRSRGR